MQFFGAFPYHYLTKSSRRRGFLWMLSSHYSRLSLLSVISGRTTHAIPIHNRRLNQLSIWFFFKLLM